MLINIGIIAIPLLFSFEKRITFYKRIPALLFSIFFTGFNFIVWDIIATKRGDWSFNPEHVFSFTIFHLPLEEILFFITVPYSCIFLYEVIRSYIPLKQYLIPRWFFVVLAIVLIGVAYNYSGQFYTSTVLVVSGVVLLLAAFEFIEVLQSNHFLIYLLGTFLGFGIVNYVLTSVPVVLYSDSAIFGIRAGTIPLEDFFYCFSMSTLWYIFYIYARQKVPVKIFSPLLHAKRQNIGSIK